MSYIANPLGQNYQPGSEPSNYHSGEYTAAEVAELFGVACSTVYRAIDRQQVEAKAGLTETSTSR